MRHHRRESFVQAVVGPSLVALTFPSSNSAQLQAGARCVAARLYSSAFALLDLIALASAVGVSLTDAEANLLEGVMVTLDCFIAVFMRWTAVIEFGLAASDMQACKIVKGSTDTVNDVAGSVRAAFAVNMRAVNRPGYAFRRSSP
ncbi:unnamed protein product [Prorocentrum cordatum]|uniref:Protein RFT1 homolog n=1 Tax=Prorocentrum cordatum TaxID=2364126 RepID=A0ABN9VCK7_9DINO|nr:unnamed protein product [Polarella glacialis]